MAKSRRGRLRNTNHVTYAHPRPISPHLRPAVWSALLGAAVAAALATPVYAEPPLPNAVPDTGSRPLPVGEVQLPGTAPTVPSGSVPAPVPTNGPLANQIYTLEVELANLGQQLLTLEEQNTTALTKLAAADSELRAARAELAKAREAADAAAQEAMKDAAALPPGMFRSDLHELGALSRLQRGQRSGGDTTGPARELARAQAAEQAAYQEFLAADAESRQTATAYATAQTQLRQKESELLELKRRNAEELIAIERAQEAQEAALGKLIGTGDIAGKAAHPRAMAAVRYALAQRGDPYLWGAEGPDRFDCSGLMWAAYRSPGADYYALPRVSRDQYYATRGRTVARNALLPGDLLFFASGSHWSTIHHVGMYVGDGKMVHAPNSGDVVKVSNVWYSRLFAATRIFGEVPAPSTPPSTTKPPTSTKPPTAKPPSTKPSASPTATPTKSQTPTPTPTNPPSDPPTDPPTTPPPPPDPTTPEPDPTPSAPPAQSSRAVEPTAVGSSPAVGPSATAGS